MLTKWGSSCSLLQSHAPRPAGESWEGHMKKLNNWRIAVAMGVALLFFMTAPRNDSLLLSHAEKEAEFSLVMLLEEGVELYAFFQPMEITAYEDVRP